MTSARAQSTMQAVRSVLTVGFGVSYLVNVVLEIPALDGFNLVLMVVVLGAEPVRVDGFVADDRSGPHRRERGPAAVPSGPARGMGRGASSDCQPSSS